MPKKNDLRNFTFIWSGIFILIGLIPLFKSGSPRIWAIILSALFLLTGTIKPMLLEPFYQVWLKIGDVIGGILSKVMLSILFYFVFTPVATILRLAGKDMLNKKIDRTASSYWIVREKQPESMKYQF
jgi:uncharacterized protein involved in cysteine biosynthesis